MDRSLRIVCLLVTALLGAGVLGAVPAAGAYPEWSKGRIGVTPVGSRVFLGEFGDESVTLSLTDLPAHAEATLTFDLFVLKSWDGNSRRFGPDVFELAIPDGPMLLHTTFSSPETGWNQAYPDEFPGGRHPAGTGASEVNTLGYSFFGDSVYHLTFTFPHSGSAIQVDFAASLSEKVIGDESWGLDNVEVAAGDEIVYSLNEPEELLTNRAGEAWAFSNDTYLAYTRYGRQTNAFARPIGGGAAIRLNPSDTGGLTGGFDPGTNTVIYQQWVNTSDLWFFDLDSGERAEVPDVNTADWEWFPRISSSYIAFHRSYDGEDGRYVDLLVYDRATADTRTIGTWKERPRLLMWLGFVGDRYLTYMLATPRTGMNVYLYDLETDTQQVIPKPPESSVFVAVVDEVNARVYFGRERSCGRTSGVWALPVDLTGDPLKLFGVPRGFSVGWSASITADAGSEHSDLYFELYDCAEERSDVLVAKAIDTMGA